MECGGISTQKQLGAAFHEAHVEPLRSEQRGAWIVLVSATSDDSEKGRGERLPFGFRHLPNAVWEAWGRLKRGEGSQGDREMVDTFSDQQGVFASANGEGEKMVMMRRRVRRVEKVGLYVKWGRKKRLS